VNRASVLLASVGSAGPIETSGRHGGAANSSWSVKRPQILDVIVEILDLGCQPAAPSP
jgi:hypothetical protein